MPSLNKGLWMLALLALSNEAGASTVQRCVGSSGHVTFTHTSCPDGSVGQRERVWNPPLGGVPPAVRHTTNQAPKARRHRTATADAGERRKSATVTEQMLPTEEKVATQKKGKKKKKAKYTPWRPTRS